MAESNTNVRRSQTVLLVEDNPGDARLVREVCIDLGLIDYLRIVSTGSDALDFVNQRGEYADSPHTDLLILDWHLPNMSSEVVLDELNSDPDTSHIPVIVTTGSLSEQELHKAYEKGANACISKPAGPDELADTIRAIEKFWLSTARLPKTTKDQQ